MMNEAELGKFLLASFPAFVCKGFLHLPPKRFQSAKVQ